MPREYFFHAFRHPETDDTPDRNLTPQGERQAEAAAKTYLTGVPISVIMRSDTPRTRQAAEIMRRAAGLTCDIMHLPLLNPFIANGPDVPNVSFNETQARVLAGRRHEETTVYEWLEGYGWVGGYLRARMQLAMAAAIHFMRENPWGATLVEDLDEIHIAFLGSSPSLETTVADPRNSRCLGHADGIVLGVREELGLLEFGTYEVFQRCPPVE